MVKQLAFNLQNGDRYPGGPPFWPHSSREQSSGFYPLDYGLTPYGASIYDPVSHSFPKRGRVKGNDVSSILTGVPNFRCGGIDTIHKLRR